MRTGPLSLNFTKLDFHPLISTSLVMLIMRFSKTYKMKTCYFVILHEALLLDSFRKSIVSLRALRGFRCSEGSELEVTTRGGVGVGRPRLAVARTGWHLLRQRPPPATSRDASGDPLAVTWELLDNQTTMFRPWSWLPVTVGPGPAGNER
jgi:hypothetical protein